MWERWSRKAGCLEDHDPVCDLCHYDSHIEAHLPVTEELKELAMLGDDDELSPSRDPFLKNFLEEELRGVGAAAEERKNELRFFIGAREAVLADDNELDKLFDSHLDKMPVPERPQTRPQERRLFNDWEAGLKRDLAEWREELVKLETRPLDKQLFYNNAKARLIRLFDAEAREAGLLPEEHDSERSFEAAHRPTVNRVSDNPVQSISQEYFSHVPNELSGWITFIELGNLEKDEIKGRRPLPHYSIGRKGNTRRQLG